MGVFNLMADLGTAFDNADWERCIALCRDLEKTFEAMQVEHEQKDDPRIGPKVCSRCKKQSMLYYCVCPDCEAGAPGPFLNSPQGDRLVAIEDRLDRLESWATAMTSGEGDD